MALKTLPVISDLTQLRQQLDNWRTTLNNSLRAASPPPPPFNFTATGIRNGIQLSWNSVDNPVTKNQFIQGSSGPDGYEILRSVSGDFSSDLVIIPIPNTQQVSYFDSVGGAPLKVSYRIRATSGTSAAPQSVKGALSGTVTATSLDATNTLGTPNSQTDQYTNDNIRAQSRLGDYGVNQYIT